MQILQDYFWKKLKYCVDKAGIQMVKVYPIIELWINQMASEYRTLIWAMISHVTWIPVKSLVVRSFLH